MEKQTIIMCNIYNVPVLYQIQLLPLQGSRNITLLSHLDTTLYKFILSF